MFYASEKTEFMVNLNKLLLCVRQVESMIAEWSHDTLNSLFGDSEFLLNLSFLFYEQTINMQINTQICCSTDERSLTPMIFELDLSMAKISTHPSVLMFEKCLNYLTDEYLAKHLPPLSCSAFFSSEAVLEFIRNLFSTRYELECDNDFSSRKNEIFDVVTYMSKPSAESDLFSSNPITLSFRPLVSNLNHLNLYANDPFREAVEEADMFGRQMEQLSFACFFLSFYTIGWNKGVSEDTVASSNKLSLFENPMQNLYELRHLKLEFEALFAHESICDDWKSRMIESLRGDHELYSQFYEVKTNVCLLKFFLVQNKNKYLIFKIQDFKNASNQTSQHQG